jgi:hypothetical protein
MSEKLPRLTASDIIKFLKKAVLFFLVKAEVIKYTKTKQEIERLFHFIQAKFFTRKF